ncbi:hypothetical protein ACTFIR_003922 [Dictyostelium discoideum]
MNSSMSKSTKMSPFQIVYGFNPPTPVNHFNSLTKTRIPMSNIKKIVRDNIVDAQINTEKYYNRGRGDVIFVVGNKVMVKRKFYQTNLSKDLISHKLESKNCGPFMITAIHGNNVTLDLLVRENWNNMQKKQLNSRRERENATTEAIEPIVSSPLSQEVQNSQPSLPTTPRQQNSNSNQSNKSKKRKSRNKNTSSDDDDDDDELDLSLQLKTTRSGRKVTHKRL